MKRTLLLCCSLLILGTTSAQKSELFKTAKKPQKEKLKEGKEAVFNKNKALSDSLYKASQQELQQKVRNQVSLRTHLPLQDEPALKEGTFLDEMITEGIEKRTYTYSREGRRELETSYRWESNEWVWSSQARYEYQYNSDGLYTQRSLYSSYTPGGAETEVNRVLVSYADGNRYYKHYALLWDPISESELFLFTHETGYDSKGREILYKSYEWDGTESKLVNWNERKYNAQGEEILEIYWYGLDDEQSGSKKEILDSGLTHTENNYLWDQDAQDWKLENQEVTTRDNQGNILQQNSMYRYDDYTYRNERTRTYNSAGRLTSELVYNYEDDELVYGWKDEFTYDAYNRIIYTLYQEYEGGKFVNESKTEFTYWGTEKIDQEDEEDFEGPILTYSYHQWEDNQWELDEELVVTRNSEGIITSGTSTQRDEFYVNDDYVHVMINTVGTFDAKGNLTSSVTNYVDESGNIVNERKDSYAYDSQNRMINQTSWIKKGGEWDLDEEENYAYDSEGRETLNEYRYKENENYWYGSRKVTIYEANLVQVTDYNINRNTGEFYTYPSNIFSDGTLPDGTRQNYYLYYQDQTAVNGMKEETKTEGNKETTTTWEWDMDAQDWVGTRKSSTDTTPVLFAIPTDPNLYNDGIESGTEPGPESYITLDELYTFENGNWVLQYKSEFHKEPNGDLILTWQHSDEIETTVYSFDSKDRVLKITRNETDVVVYTYNDEGLIATMNDNGTVSTYHYSVHQYIPLDIEEVHSDENSFTIEGRTIISSSQEALLHVYALDGRVIASGTGSVIVPEKGIYILSIPEKNLKITIR